MHASAPLNSISSPALPTTRHASGLPFYGTFGARTGACSSLRSALLSRTWKDSSIPFKMSWMRSARGPAEHSKSPESRKPHQKAADGFSGLRSILVSSTGSLPKSVPTGI